MLRNALFYLSDRRGIRNAFYYNHTIQHHGKNFGVDRNEKKKEPRLQIFERRQDLRVLIQGLDQHNPLECLGSVRRIVTCLTFIMEGGI